MIDFIYKQKSFADSPKRWSVDVAAIDPWTFDLSVNNPNGGEKIVHRSPQEIMDEIDAVDAETQRMNGLYKRKLAALKQSLLQPGGSGEL